VHELTPQIGEMGAWTVVDDTGISLAVNGRLVGVATSKKNSHNHTEDTLPTNCGACRWYEVIIIKVDPAHYRCMYYASTQGHSSLPGERTYYRLRSATGAYELVEVLTVRRNTGVYLPAPASRALAMGASLEKDIEIAYINRAVV
jgi:hypothetical protein